MHNSKNSHKNLYTDLILEQNSIKNNTIFKYKNIIVTSYPQKIHYLIIINMKQINVLVGLTKTLMAFQRIQCMRKAMFQFNIWIKLLNHVLD